MCKILQLQVYVNQYIMNLVKFKAKKPADRSAGLYDYLVEFSYLAGAWRVSV